MSETFLGNPTFIVAVTVALGFIFLLFTLLVPTEPMLVGSVVRLPDFEPRYSPSSSNVISPTAADTSTAVDEETFTSPPTSAQVFMRAMHTQAERIADPPLYEPHFLEPEAPPAHEPENVPAVAAELPARPIVEIQPESAHEPFATPIAKFEPEFVVHANPEPAREPVTEPVLFVPDAPTAPREPSYPTSPYGVPSRSPWDTYRPQGAPVDEPPTNTREPQREETAQTFKSPPRAVPPVPANMRSIIEPRETDEQLSERPAAKRSTKAPEPIATEQYEDVTPRARRLTWTSLVDESADELDLPTRLKIIEALGLVGGSWSREILARAYEQEMDATVRGAIFLALRDSKSAA